MATPLGLRTVHVYTTVAGEEKQAGNGRGSVLYTEVTNGTASEVKFTVNSFPEQGHNGVPIPIPPNTTRALPIQLYNFKADGVVTVVAYGQ